MTSAGTPEPSSGGSHVPATQPELKPWPWRPPTISETQEYLVHLYLRLNGYLTTGFIVHSKYQGRTEAQVDALAVRHPYNAEPEREIEPSAFLNPSSDLTDVLICEVKSNPNDFAFNKGLRDDRDALTSVLRWVGLFQPNELGRFVDGVVPLLKDNCAPDAAKRGITSDAIRVRALICAPAVRSGDTARAWFLPREEVLGFVHECFSHRRERSGNKYSYRDWGSWLEPIVRYFKAVPPGREPELGQLYRYIGTIKDDAAVGAERA